MKRRALITGGLILSAATVMRAASKQTPNSSGTNATPDNGTPDSQASPIAEATPIAVQVAIKGTVFNPGTTRITAGTTVTWTNFAMRVHTVTSDDGDYLRSGRIGPADTWTFTFSESGSFAYLCDYHNNMDGIVIVTDQ